MNKEKAIKYLNEFIIFKKISNITEEEAIECFELAIKALQQQTSDDCISRKAVLESLHSKFVDGFNSDKWWNSTSVLYAINETPPANPQPKTEQETHMKKGHWIGDKGTTVYVNSEGNVTESRDKGETVKCSECGEWLVGSDEYVCGGRFCPSCGIKMEEKK